MLLLNYLRSYSPIFIKFAAHLNHLTMHDWWENGAGGSVLQELCLFVVLDVWCLQNMANSACFVKSTPHRAFSVSFKYFVSMLQTYWRCACESLMMTK